MSRAAKPLGHMWVVEWANPYTDPPDGMDRVGVSATTLGARNIGPPAVVSAELDKLGPPGSGWGLYCDAIMPPPRKLSEKSKQSSRRKRLRTKLEKKHPLFADQFYEEKLAEMPEYYGVGVSEI